MILDLIGTHLKYAGICSKFVVSSLVGVCLEYVRDIMIRSPEFIPDFKFLYCDWTHIGINQELIGLIPEFFEMWF